MPVPVRRVSTSSFLFTLAFVNQSDCIASLATPAVDSFAGNPAIPFGSLPVDLGLGMPPFSLVTCAGSRLTPSARLVVDAVLARA